MKIYLPIKKTVLKAIALTTITLNIPLISLATGVVSGGGGRGIFCTDTNNPQQGRLLDIYEGDILFN